MSEDARQRPDEEDPYTTDEEEVEMEWHIWLAVMLAIAGALLIVFPPGFWPEIGYALVGLAAVAWIAKTVIERA